MSYPAYVVEKFHDNYIPVPESGCWLWIGSLLRKGYGAMKVGRKSHVPMRAHRLSYELHFGNIPSGLFICHRCDTPSCVNPDHLYAGTAKDNCVDRDSRGRGRFFLRENGGPTRVATGVDHYKAKFTEDDIRNIRRMLSEGISQTAIGRKYGVAQAHISLIKSGKIWRGVGHD